MGNIADIYGGQAFDANRDDAATGFDALPAGWYPVQIDDAEVKGTSKKTGKIMKLEMTIVGDKFAGRKFFANINLVNPNEKAMEIGQRELAAIGQACGLMAITDSSELLGKHIQVRVKVVKDDDLDVKDNEVTAYKALAGPVAQAQQQPAQQQPVETAPPAQQPVQQPQAAASKSKRPWEK